MKNLQISKNYAKAILANLFSEQKENQMQQELMLMDDLLAKNDQCKKIFDSPVEDKTIKIKLIKSIAKEQNLSQNLEMFLSLLVINNRINMLSDIIKSFQNLLNEKRKIKFVEITSAKELSVEEKKYLLERIEDDLKQSISTKFSQDKTLIGGIVIKYDSKSIDLSVLGALNKINQQIKNISLGE